MLAVTKVLLDDPLAFLEETTGPDRSTAKTISDVRRAHIPHWKCFQTNKVPIASTSTSHRSSTAVTQRKRKRKNSDGEYTPHQRAENDQSTTSSVRRSSKRLAASARLEQQPSITASGMSYWSIIKKRSSSSTSALTSASSSSLDRPQTPSEFFDPDLPASTSKSKPKKSRPEGSPSPEVDWSDADEFSELDRRFSSSAKIGFPPKEKKVANDYNYSTSTAYRLIEVGDRFRPTPYL